MSQKRRKRRRVAEYKSASSSAAIAIEPVARKPSLIRVIAYGPNQFLDRELADPAALREFLPGKSPAQPKYPVLWINVDSVSDPAVVDAIGELFGLHRLALEDVVHLRQRAKVEEYGDVLFLVARMADLQKAASTEQLCMFVGPSFVLTFQEAPGDCWEPVRKRLREGLGRIRHESVDYLAYVLLDAVIDDYFPVLERYGERLNAVEEQALDGDRETLDEIHEIKTDLLMLRRAVWPHREMLAALCRETHPRFSSQTRVFLRDCYDHVIQLVDLIETYRELTADVRDLYMTGISNRINETMRVLTIISTIFIPLTFIAGIYGMNFQDMPELKWHWGYPVCLAAMLVTSVALVVFFWWRGWLTSPTKLPPGEATGPH